MRTTPIYGTTPFPNILLDEAMPHFKDTEWRILCVIVRQTCGWRSGKGKSDRKRRDWLTREQLKARTGRDSEALARAIDALVKKNYIVAENEDGQSLSSPGERRRNHTKIFYRLASHLDPSHLAPKTELATRAVCSLMPGDERQSELDNAAKANRTKEKQTKETFTKREFPFLVKQARNSRIQRQPEQRNSGLESLAQRVFREHPDSFRQDTANSHTGRQAQLLEESLPEAAGESVGLSEEVGAFTALFTETARRKLEQCVSVHLSPEERTRLEELLEKHKGLNWTPALELFFQCDLGHVTRRNYSLLAFLDSCNIFLVRIPGGIPFLRSEARRNRWRKAFD